MGVVTHNDGGLLRNFYYVSTYNVHVYISCTCTGQLNSHMQGGSKQKHAAKGSVASFFSKKPPQGVCLCADALLHFFKIHNGIF